MNPPGSQRRRRLGVVLATGLASLVALSATVADASSTSRTPAVSATQDLVSLAANQTAHAKPSVASKSLGIVPARTPITGEHTTLPVLGAYGSWLLVRLPGRPNGHSGWISEKHTTPSVTAWHLVVDTAARHVIVYHAGHVVRSMRAVVGKPSTPTPAGEYFVEESISLDRAAVGSSLRARAQRPLEHVPGVRGRPRADRAAWSRQRRRCARDGRLTRLRPAR